MVPTIAALSHALTRREESCGGGGVAKTPICARSGDRALSLGPLDPPRRTKKRGRPRNRYQAHIRSGAAVWVSKPHGNLQRLSTSTDRMSPNWTLGTRPLMRRYKQQRRPKQTALCWRKSAQVLRSVPRLVSVVSSPGTLPTPTSSQAGPVVPSSTLRTSGLRRRGP